MRIPVPPLALALLWLGAAAPARAGGWGFASPLGGFAPDELARGLDAFRAGCAGCHGIGEVRVRDLTALGFTRDDALARAAAAAAAGGAEAPAVPAGPGQTAPVLSDALAPVAGRADAMMAFLAAGHAGVPGVRGARAHAIVAFLASVARPHLAQRRRLGVRALCFLALLAGAVALGRARDARSLLPPGPPR